jgi:hypothetical protein
MLNGRRMTLIQVIITNGSCDKNNSSCLTILKLNEIEVLIKQTKYSVRKGMRSFIFPIKYAKKNAK